MEATTKQLKPFPHLKWLIVFVLIFGMWLARTSRAQNNCSSVILCATSGSIGGSLLASVGATASATVTVQGAQVGMVCLVQPSDGTDMIALGAIPTCTITAANTVTVRLIAIIILTPASKTYNVRVIQ